MIRPVPREFQIWVGSNDSWSLEANVLPEKGTKVAVAAIEALVNSNYVLDLR